LPSEAGSEADLVLREIESLLSELHPGRVTRVDLRSDLADVLGLDSLAMVELHDRLERAFGVELPEEVLATAPTPGDWLRAIMEARGRVAGAGPAHLVAVPPPRASGGAWPEHAETLTEALAWHVEAHPDLVCINLLGAGNRLVEEVSYSALLGEATAVARGLLGEGLGPGERVAIMLPTGREYFVTFLAVILAGGVPVPIYPPARPSAIQEHLRRQARLLGNAGVSVLVTVPEARLAANLVRLHVASLRSVRTPDVLRDAGHGPQALPAVSADDIALLQYTSGSTGDPKGVVLTHAQVLANVRAMGQAVEVTPADVFVSWLPLYHDMGLIGAWHASLFFGMSLVIMSPLRFLARPAAWLQAMSAYSGTLSAAPNFAYQSCVDRIADAELDGLDLSRWRVAINGSEPVSALTLQRFVDRFSRCGFRRTAMCPAYGLAEVGVGVAFTPLGHGPHVDVVAGRQLHGSGRAVVASPDDPGAVHVVSCGTPLPGYEIRVAGPRGDELPDRREGRVECRGPSATAGYFCNDEANRTLWRGGWLDTGDLGYIADGELYLTGRAKDMVIRGGRNLHPEELERAVGELDGVRRGGVAAFASADPRRGTERLVVVAETELEAPEARAALQAQVTKAAIDLLDTSPDEVVLAPPGAVLRTPSGKIRRAATRDALEAGVLERRAAPVMVQLLRFAWSGLAGAGRRTASSAAAWCFGAYVWGLVGLIGVPLWIAVHIPFTRRARWTLTRAAGRTLQTLAAVGLRVDGTFLPADIPTVVVANHRSFVDALALLLASPDPVVFVASSDLERQPLVGSFLRRLGCAFVHRGEAERSVEEVERLANLVREGHRLVIFPEGSITSAPGLRPFHLGAFAVAAATGCPVVPVGIRGTRDIVRPGSRLPHRGDVTVAVGSPVMPAGDDFAARLQMARRARRAVADLSGERAAP